MLHHSEVIHGSSPNKSNKDRIGLVIGYKNINAKIDKKKLNKHAQIVKKNINYLKRNSWSKISKNDFFSSSSCKIKNEQKNYLILKIL